MTTMIFLLLAVTITSAVLVATRHVRDYRIRRAARQGQK
jgi:hypothetical protein